LIQTDSKATTTGMYVLGHTFRKGGKNEASDVYIQNAKLCKS
jgi:hypothetical protein